MHDLLPIAEQLDRVAVELRHDHPVHNRLALVLIDNTVEIMIRRALWVHVGIGGDFTGITARHRIKARSQKIADRVSVLAEVQLTQVEADFVIAAHEHRNEAYHEWHVGERFIRPLCFHYYDFACAYLARFSMAFLSWYGDYHYSEVAKKYEKVAKGDKGGFRDVDREALADALRGELPSDPLGKFQDALADDLEDDRQRVARSYRFLIDNSPKNETAAFLLARAQFEYSRDEVLAKKGLDLTSFGTERRSEAVKLAKARRKEFMPKYRAIPHGSWSQSIQRVPQTDDPMLAFVRFQRARKSMSFLLNAVCDSAMRLEADLYRD